MHIDAADLQKLKDIETQYGQLTKSYGEIRYDQLILKTQLENLETQMLELEQIRAQNMIELQEKLGGTGRIDLETGTWHAD